MCNTDINVPVFVIQRTTTTATAGRSHGPYRVEHAAVFAHIVVVFPIVPVGIAVLVGTEHNQLTTRAGGRQQAVAVLVPRHRETGLHNHTYQHGQTKHFSG
jgi:hypothetical protein